MPRGNTVTSTTYADLLKNHLRPAVKSKLRGILNTGVLLQHDNARPHTARSTVATIQDLSFECLPHPPYSPELAPSDFHVFGQVKQRWEASLSGPTNKFNRRCTSGCTLCQKIFFLEVSMHFQKAETLVWNTMETTQKNNVIVYLMCLINYEIKIFKFFHLTQVIKKITMFRLIKISRFFNKISLIIICVENCQHSFPICVEH